MIQKQQHHQESCAANSSRSYQGISQLPAGNPPEAAVVVVSPEQEEAAAAAASEEPVEQEEPDDVPELEAQGEDDSSDEEEEQGPRQSARIAGGIIKPSGYAMAMRIAKSK
jgi:hypothetical protein